MKINKTDIKVLKHWGKNLKEAKRLISVKWVVGNKDDSNYDHSYSSCSYCRVYRKKNA